MGLDVNLYAEVSPTMDELARAEKFFTARSRFGDPWDATKAVLFIEDEEWFTKPRVTVRTLARYYGECYERGDWPSIYGAIRVLQGAFPEAKVFYGSDSTDGGEECTDERLAEVWAHFLSADGDNYRRRVDAFNEGAR